MSTSSLTAHAVTSPGPEPGAGVDISRALLDPDWDAFVDSAPGGHHLQTSRWAGVKATHGWQPVRLRVHRQGEFVGGAQLLVRRMRVGAIAYCPRGPLLCDHDRSTLRALLDGLASLARRERILYVKVQPPAGREDMEPMLRNEGFVKSDMPAATVATVRIDLRRPVDEILASMRSATRANIRKATRKGIAVRGAGTSGLAAFGELVAETSRRQGGLATYAAGYYAEILRQFGHRGELLLAELDGEVLAGAIIIGCGDTVAYKMGGWSGHRAGLHPNELMHWHAMQWARERGYRYYDFEGIDESVARAIRAGEELPESAHRGFTRFKLGFGGEVVLHPRPYDRSFHRLLAWPARIAAPRLSRFQARAHSLQGRALVGG